ncbi:MAG: hypothetical protein M3N13_00935 [Candidatus Eremiobacteraeota bacterium]|nr:hypothetical protein [Candidatus Eremiobacteraeota bacterium]
MRFVRYVLTAAAALAPCGETSCSPPAREQPSEGTFLATSVLLPALGADRISSAARAPNGDVILGVVGYSNGGSIVRVLKRKRVVAFRTTDPVAAVGMSDAGGICWVPYVRPVVTCKRDDGQEHTYPIPMSRPAPQLLRVGPKLFAVDVVHGRVFTVGRSRVAYFASFTPGASVTSGPADVIALTTTERCSVRAGARLSKCVLLRPPLRGAAAVAAAGDAVFVSDYPAHALTVIGPDGTTGIHNLPLAPYGISIRNDSSAWIGLSDSGGHLALYAASQRELRRYELPSKLKGYLYADAILLPHAIGDDLAVVDNHQRLVTFLTLPTR